jgi:hypothetical protein
MAGQRDRDEAQRARSSLTGRYWAHVWDLDCVLELLINELGCVEGWFEADGQRLEVSGGAPNAGGEISGVIRAANLSEPFASFRVRAEARNVRLEVRTAGDPVSLEHVVFVRLT